MNNWKYNIAPNEIITTGIGKIFFTDEGILVMEYANNLDFTLDLAQKAISICEEITNGKKAPVLIMTGDLGSMDNDTRKFLSSQRLENHRSAAAIVINNLPHRIIANFIIRIRHNYYPSKIFKCRKEGLKWLKTFIN